MADNGFNGSTATFAGAALGDGLRAIRYTDSCAKVQTSGSSESEHKYRGGLPNREVVIDFVGTTTVTQGSTGAIVVTLNDGATAPSMTNARCMSVNYGGNLDGELAGSATFKVKGT